MHQQHMMKTLAVFVSPSFYMLLLDTCWRSVFIALVYALCMFLCLFTRILCVPLRRSPFILINALQVNFTHGIKEIFFFFFTISGLK